MIMQPAADDPSVCMVMTLITPAWGTKLNRNMPFIHSLAVVSVGIDCLQHHTLLTWLCPWGLVLATLHECKQSGLHGRMITLWSGVNFTVRILYTHALQNSSTNSAVFHHTGKWKYILSLSLALVWSLLALGKPVTQNKWQNNLSN